MDSSNKPNRVHPLEACFESKISEYSGYVELLKELLGKYDETHDKAIEAGIEALTYRIYNMKRILRSEGLVFP